MTMRSNPAYLRSQQGFSGEAVRDSRIVVAFSILSIVLTFGGL